MATFLETVKNFADLPPGEYQRLTEMNAIQKYFSAREQNPSLTKKEHCSIAGIGASKLNQLLRKHGYTKFIRTRRSAPASSEMPATPAVEGSIRLGKQKSSLKKERGGVESSRTESLLKEHSVL